MCICHMYLIPLEVLKLEKDHVHEECDSLWPVYTYKKNIDEENYIGNDRNLN